jgi:cell division protein FtsW
MTATLKARPQPGGRRRPPNAGSQPPRRTATRQRTPRRLAKRQPTRRRPLLPESPAAAPPASFYVLAALVGVLTILGLILVLSASSLRELHAGRSPFGPFARQAGWACVGTIAMVIIARVPYNRWRRWVTPLLGLGMGLMLLPFLPGVGLSVGGAHAWVKLGPLTFQPSEFLKIAVLMYCADLLTKRQKAMHLARATLGPCLLVVGLASGAMLLQSDLGSAIVLCSIVMAVAFIGGTPVTPFLGVTAGVGFTGFAFVISTPYRRDRWLAFLDLASHRSTLNFQVTQGLVAIADGRIGGVGIGASHQKGWLPLSYSDFIFAVLAEELGLIGVVAVLGCYVAFCFLAVQVALRAKDHFGMLLAGGVAAWIGIQAIINVAGVVGLMPLTGLTLPFVSSGGTSLFATMSAVGLLLSVARSEHA